MYGRSLSTAITGGPRFFVEKNGAPFTFRGMKSLWILALLAVAMCGLSGCASSDTATAKGDPVPGEQTGEESRLGPGTGAGPNASVKW